MRATDSESKPVAGPNALRDHLANERTFLAWIRTALAIVALGFVVARFGLLLRDLGIPHAHPKAFTLGSVVGIVLVFFGATMAVLAGFRFLQIRRDIELSITDMRPWPDIVLAGVVAGASFLLAVYIVVTA